jgi:trehalose utilization protein
MTTAEKVRVLVWSEFTEPKEVYPEGIHGEIASFLNSHPSISARTSQLSDVAYGLSQEALDGTDVLFWWGHAKHNEVGDDAVERVVTRVRDGGMGFVPIHSSHFSKPFIALMGTKCSLGSWDEDGLPERVHVETPDHPIAKGIRDFIIERTETYAEPFDVPVPKDVVFTSVFHDGTRFRSGLTWEVGKGRIFYFRPGHETYPIMMNPSVRRILTNAALWAARRI